MQNEFRLQNYLARIGYDGPLDVSTKTLAALKAAHLEAIPFEGLDPLLGRPVKLNLAALQAKLVDGNRGGYCFEQNALFQAALEAIGFKIIPLGARVRWMSPPDSPLGPKAHMLLKVDLPEGAFLADVGFGVCLLDTPLQFKTEIAQTTAMGTYRLRESDGLFWLDAKRQGGWRTMYVFDLQPQIQSDYELGNYFTSTSPLVPFTSRLIMERLAGERRYRLVDLALSTEGRDGEVISERKLASARDLSEALRDVFRITPPSAVEEIFSKVGG